MTKYSSLVILFGLITSVACDPTDDRLTIINETNRPLFYTTSRFDTIEGGCPYERFIEISNNDTIWIDSDDFLKPKSQKKHMILSNWEQVIPNNFNGELKLYVFDADTLIKYNWDEIKRKNKYFSKYKLTIKELEETDWTIRIKQNLIFNTNIESLASAISVKSVGKIL